MKKNPDHISRSEVLKILYDEKIIPELVKEDWESDGKKPTKWILQQLLNFHNQPPPEGSKLENTLYTFANYVHYAMLEIYASHLHSLHLITASTMFPFLSTEWEFFNDSNKKDKEKFLKEFVNDMSEDDFKDLNNEYENLIYGAKNPITKLYSYFFFSYEKSLKDALKRASNTKAREKEFRLLAKNYGAKELIEGYKKFSGFDPRKLHEYINKKGTKDDIDYTQLLAPKMSRVYQYREWYSTLENAHAFAKTNSNFKQTRKIQRVLFAEQWLEFENLEKFIPKDLKKKNRQLSPEVLGLYDFVIDIAHQERVKNFKDEKIK